MLHKGSPRKRLAAAPDSAQLPGMARELMPSWMVTPAYGRELLFERIAINEGALCIECKDCGRRSALTRENCKHIRPGNKQLVKSVTFRCSNRCCGSTDVRLYNAHTEDEATMWLAGDRLPSGQQVN
jgi:hypothetical protein